MADLAQAICPVCGRAAGRQVTLRAADNNMVLASRNFWTITEDFDKDKPFGVVQNFGGRGPKAGNQGEVIRYFQPNEDEWGFFPLVKRRLIRAIAEWLRKGWITRAELDAAIREIKTEG